MAIENGKSKETRLYSRVSSLDDVKVAVTMEVLQTLKDSALSKPHISVFGLRELCEPLVLCVFVALIIGDDV